VCILTTEDGRCGFDLRDDSKASDHSVSILSQAFSFPLYFINFPASVSIGVSDPM